MSEESTLQLRLTGDGGQSEAGTEGSALSAVSQPQCMSTKALSSSARWHRDPPSPLRWWWGPEPSSLFSERTGCEVGRGGGLVVATIAVGGRG